MTRAACAIGLGNLEDRLVVSGTAELTRLAEGWNEMLARLQDSIVRMRRFTADAAHELKTPLTGLRATAELALRRPRDPNEYRAALAEIVGISARIDELGEGLLTLARGDDAGWVVSSGSVNLLNFLFWSVR